VPARTILLADDHPLFRAAMRMAVERVSPGARLLEAATLGEAAGLTREHPGLDLILLDLRMPGASGVAGVALLHAEAPGTPILVVSAEDRTSSVEQAIAFGAVGFVSKRSELADIEAAIAGALAGARPAPARPAEPEVADMAARVASLTPTQLRVLMGVLAGRLNKQIAHDLAISEATVKAHMTQLMRKLGVHNRTQVALAARALDLPHEEGSDLAPG
jgi:DNA-binding NarL/FixJ family response regulator